MATGTTISSFTLDEDELGWTGQDLHRPESVVAAGPRLSSFRSPVPDLPMSHWR